jgi:hypothetical protein
LADHLDVRSQARFPALLGGAVLARSRRTVTRWLRAAGIAADFRPASGLLGTVGRRAADLAVVVWLRVALPRPSAGQSRLLFARDDTPTRRYGPCVEGAGIHPNPTPEPAGPKFVYGHVWVALAWVVRHRWWGAIARPLRACLDVRRKDVGKLPPWYGWPFRTELALAAELVHGLATWRPAGGVIRVVLTARGKGWAASFCTDPQASVADVLTAVADRASLEQAFHDLKEVWGAGRQPLRNRWANLGAFPLNLWLHTVGEVGAWDRPPGRLLDRAGSPWDNPDRRPSHADRRRALQRESLRAA